MPIHPTYAVEKLQKQLQERLDRLLVAMHGKEVTESDLQLRSLRSPHRWVRSDDVRVAVDDFSTILKEIKASLGKR